jgi:hypothetical protein
MTTFVAISDGVTLRPAGRPNAEMLAKVPKGKPVRIEVEESRNPKRHAMFFAVVAEAFKHWPEGHSFAPESTEHLRAWLLCKAGHCETMDIHVPNGSQLSMHPLMLALIAFTGSKSVFVGQTKSGNIRAFRPKSQSFSRCKEADIKPIVDRVYDIIAIETGMAIADLKREAEKECQPSKRKPENA